MPARALNARLPSLLGLLSSKGASPVARGTSGPVGCPGRLCRAIVPADAPGVGTRIAVVRTAHISGGVTRPAPAPTRPGPRARTPARTVGTGRCEWPGEYLSAPGGAPYHATVP
ncbi:hypothetical protein GCM10023257_59620 [Streptomyces hyderabadensis]|uniref:Uncharacterized protein n=1 Tax=Streptomyces hyderabadensis TaxID=598549 RepID=A0ABP9IQ85_9ACTN